MTLLVNKLQELFSFADFLANSLGNNTEIVIHDTRDVSQSIVYIHNGHLSGRKIGDSMTNFALKLVKRNQHMLENYTTAYYATNATNRKFRSSTYFIKNQKNSLIGMLCINTDMTDLENVKHMLDSITQVSNNADGSPSQKSIPPLELLSGNPTDTIRLMIQHTLARYPVDVERLTKDEKVAILAELDEAGVFLMKGGVSLVASELKLSGPTVYRYLQKLHQP